MGRSAALRIIAEIARKSTNHGVLRSQSWLPQHTWNAQVHSHQTPNTSPLAICLQRHFSSQTILQSNSKSNMADVPEGILLGLGNPLLDITINGTQEFLDKYDLLANNAILAEDKHMNMFDEMVKQFKLKYVAGGATQNSIRVAQWLLQKPNATTFFGCVGDDDNGQILLETGREVGVNVHYQKSKTQRTGVCGAVITNQDRSLVTYLGAANHFSHTFLEDPENWALVEKAQIYYIGGYVWTVSPKSIMDIAKHAAEKNKLLVMNLSAPFLCSYFTDPKYDIMSYIDILFGNETEAATFCSQQGINIQDRNLMKMAQAVMNLPKKTSRSRMVVFTHGPYPTIVAHDGKVEVLPIIPVEKSSIKDTTGCGDAFAGGFLSQLVQGHPLKQCVHCGNYAASTVIQYMGCCYPEKPNFK